MKHVGFGQILSRWKEVCFEGLQAQKFQKICLNSRKQEKWDFSQMLFKVPLIINVLKIRFILVGIAGIFHFSAQIVVIKLLFYLSLNTKPSQTKPTNHLSWFKAFQLNILFWLEINFLETSMIPPIIKPNLIDAPFTSFPNYFMKPIDTHLQIKSIYTSLLKYLATLTQKTLLLVYNSMLLLVFGIMCVITHPVIIVFYFIWREREREL